MDFFALQDEARRKTNLLVFYYCLAVFAIIFSVYFVIVLMFFNDYIYLPYYLYWDTGLFVLVMCATLLVVGIGTLTKVLQLRQGGAVVAEMLGGTLVNPFSDDIDQRRLINVVEEMALASGTPVPPVYLLANEEGINAFAAGFNSSDAVIGVTKGCMKRLNREQLQGVIAHEFSHIINGDMRLNIRLIGVLAGIIAIANIGYIILRTAGISSRRSRVKDSRRNKEVGAIIVLGIALMIIGYLGVFFAKIIKSAVSRQREYLADASAVQFTRSSSGLAGALKVIGKISEGSQVSSKYAEEASHLFFANITQGFFSNIMSTHPKLLDRIKVLEPSFTGNFDSYDLYVSSDDSSSSSMFVNDRKNIVVDTDHVIDSLGYATMDHLEYASGVLQAIPIEISNAVHEPFSSCVVVYSLLLDTDLQLRSSQLDYLCQHLDTRTYDLVVKFSNILEDADDRIRLPIIEIVLAALRQLSADQYDVFQQHVDNLIHMDDHVSWFEYSLYSVIRRNLKNVFHSNSTNTKPIKSLRYVRNECCILLSALVQAGHLTDETQRLNAFSEGMNVLFGNEQSDQYVGDIVLDHLDRSLDVLSEALPAIKRKIVKACITCVSSDQEITVEESEMLRAVVNALGCPLSPLI